MRFSLAPQSFKQAEVSTATANSASKSSWSQPLAHLPQQPLCVTRCSFGDVPELVLRIFGQACHRRLHLPHRIRAPVHNVLAGQRNGKRCEPMTLASGFQNKVQLRPQSSFTRVYSFFPSGLTTAACDNNTSHSHHNKAKTPLLDVQGLLRLALGHFGCGVISQILRSRRQQGKKSGSVSPSECWRGCVNRLLLLG